MTYIDAKPSYSNTSLEHLIAEINFQRSKDARQLLKDEGDEFVRIESTKYWTEIFVKHFLYFGKNENNGKIDSDDLLFFVRKRVNKYSLKMEVNIEVYRKDNKKLPIGEADIDWEETVYLNLIVHEFEYKLTLAICTRTSPKELQVLKKCSKKVYALPSCRRMDVKADFEEMTYPLLCFMVDNFDEVFCDILVRDGEMVCVELVAADKHNLVQNVIFLGSIRYEALKRVYDSRQSSLSSKMAHKMTFGLFSNPSNQRCEFVRMKGPYGKGFAEMVVTKPKGATVETPSSEPGFSLFSDTFDNDCNSDDLFAKTHKRRLSDPSSNSDNLFRSNWIPKNDQKSKSQCEDLNIWDNMVAEIEAGDVKDGVDKVFFQGPYDFKIKKVVSSSTTLKSYEIVQKSASFLRPSCCGCWQKYEKKPLSIFSMHEIVQKKPKIEIGVDAANLLNTRRVKKFNTLPRQKLRTFRYAVVPHLVPFKVARDGTSIFYLSELKTNYNIFELGDGSYHPLWTTKGYTQTFHLWKENRRVNSVPLNAFLTFVTLPWWSIIHDLLDQQERPILTF